MNDSIAKLKLNNLHTLYEKEYPPQEWLIKKLIPIDGLVVMSAQPAHYKSWLMLTMAIAIAQGVAFLDMFEAKQAGVLIIDEESGERQLQERFRKLDTDQNLPIYYSSRTGREMDDKYAEEIVKECQEKEIGIVMVDSLIRMHSKNENDSSEMSKVLNYFKMITDSGIACLILHHHRKNSMYAGTAGEAMRGSGDILASVDVHMSLTRKENTVTISQTKNRFCEEIKPVSASLIYKDGKLKFQFVGYEKDKEEKAKELEDNLFSFINYNQGVNKSELAEAFKQSAGVAAGRVQKGVDSLIKSGRIKTTRGEKNSIKLYVDLPNNEMDDKSFIEKLFSKDETIDYTDEYAVESL